MVKNIGTHVTHCCVHHGCKYGDEDCPVADGSNLQEGACEDCPPAKEWRAVTHYYHTTLLGPVQAKLSISETDVEGHYLVEFMGQTEKIPMKHKDGSDVDLDHAKLFALCFAQELVQNIACALDPRFY